MMPQELIQSSQRDRVQEGDGNTKGVGMLGATVITWSDAATTEATTAENKAKDNILR
jgi:hypothetical protein